MHPEFREEIEKTLREQDEIYQRQFEEENQLGINEDQVNPRIIKIYIIFLN